MFCTCELTQGDAQRRRNELKLFWAIRQCERADVLREILHTKSLSPEKSTDARGVKVSDVDGFLARSMTINANSTHEGAHVDHSCRGINMGSVRTMSDAWPGVRERLRRQHRRCSKDEEHHRVY